MAYVSRARQHGIGGHGHRDASHPNVNAPHNPGRVNVVERGYGSGRHHAADTDHGLSCMGRNPDGKPHGVRAVRHSNMGKLPK